MKFSTKLTALFSVILFIAVSAISGLVYSSNIRTLEHHIKDRLQNQAFHTMDKIDRMLFERQADIKTLASDPVISSGKATPARITERLKRYKENYKYYASLSFFDLNRVRLADTTGLDIGKQHGLTEYWPELAQGKELVSGIFRSESLPEAKSTMYFTHLVKDKNNIPFGVVVARISLEKLNGMINQSVGIYNIAKDFHIELLDKEGLILYSTKNMAGILREKSDDWDMIEKQKAKGVVTGAIKWTNPKENTGEEILAFTSEQGFEDFKGNGWILLSEAPTRIVFASVFELQKKIIAVSMVIWLLAFLIISRFSLRLSGPIKEMSAASEEIAGGNLEARVETAFNGEIGHLVASFNKMAAELKGQRDRLITDRIELETVNSDLEKLFNAKVKAEEDLKRKNLELENAIVSAEAGNMAKSAFLANMSHELRTPLNHIIGFSEMMREGMTGPLTDKQREYAGDIAESGNRLLSVLNEVLELSRIDTGEAGLELTEFDIGKLLEKSLALFKEKALKHNMKMSLEVEDGIAIITADQKKVKQVVMSLLGNAFKFTPDGGSVHLHARKGIGDWGLGVSKEEQNPKTQTLSPDTEFYEISVEDTGIGISEEGRKRLFKSFEQLESPYTKTHEGIGLGLFLSRKLVKMHGGRIWEGCEEGKGCKFIFTLPCKY